MVVRELPKRLYYKNERNNKTVNNNGGDISGNVRISFPENIFIGKNSYINGGDVIASKNAKIIIGDNVLVSYNVHIRTDMHIHKDVQELIVRQGHDEKDIKICDNVWIGYGAQILSGVVIAEGCIIGAGAVVTKSTAPYGVYVGVPAKRIKDR